MSYVPSAADEDADTVSVVELVLLTDRPPNVFAFERSPAAVPRAPSLLASRLNVLLWTCSERCCS